MIQAGHVADYAECLGRPRKSIDWGRNVIPLLRGLRGSIEPQHQVEGFWADGQPVGARDGALGRGRCTDVEGD